MIKELTITILCLTGVVFGCGPDIGGADNLIVENMIDFSDDFESPMDDVEHEESDKLPERPLDGRRDVRLTKEVIAHFMGPMTNSVFDKIRSTNQAANVDTDLACGFSDDTKCCWHNTDLLDSIDWHVVKHEYNKSAAREKLPLSEGTLPEPPFLATGARQAVSGPRYSMLTSCPILCQKSNEGLLHFDYWVTKPVMLDVCVLPLDIPEFTYCRSVTNRPARVVIPKQKTPFTLVIIASEFADWPGGMAAIDNIRYEADICTVGEVQKRVNEERDAKVIESSIDIDQYYDEFKAQQEAGEQPVINEVIEEQTNEHQQTKEKPISVEEVVEPEEPIVNEVIEEPKEPVIDTTIPPTTTIEQPTTVTTTTEEPTTTTTEAATTTVSPTTTTIPEEPPSTAQTVRPSVRSHEFDDQLEHLIPEIPEESLITAEERTAEEIDAPFDFAGHVPAVVGPPSELKWEYAEMCEHIQCNWSDREDPTCGWTKPRPGDITNLDDTKVFESSLSQLRNIPDDVERNFYLGQALGPAESAASISPPVVVPDNVTLNFYIFEVADGVELDVCQDLEQGIGWNCMVISPRKGKGELGWRPMSFRLPRSGPQKRRQVLFWATNEGLEHAGVGISPIDIVVNKNGARYRVDCKNEVLALIESS